MKKHNPIDELFRRRLVRHESAVPEGMFDRIQSGRKKARKPYVALLPWLTGLAASVLLLIVAFAWGYQQGKHDQSALSHFPIGVNEQPLAGSAIAEDDQTLSETVGTEDEMINQKQAETQAFAQNDHTASIVNDTEALPFVPAYDNNITPAEISEVEPTEAWLEEIKDNVAVTEKSVQTESSSLVNKRAKLSEFDFLEGLDIMAVTEAREEGLLSSLSNSPKCAKFSTRSWHFDADLMVGPAYGFHTLEDGNRESGDHLKNRQKTEQGITSFGAQIRISALSPNGLALRTGLSFTQLNQRFEYHNENETTVTYIDRLGPNGEILDTDTTYARGSRHMVDHNKYQFLDIPLQVGYEFTAGKLKLGLNAGASVNVLLAAQGVFQSPATGVPVSFASSNSTELNTVPAYRTQIGASLDVSATIRYHLTGRYSLLIEPYIRHYTGSLTEQEYSLSHQATVSGLNLGLRIRL